MDIAIIIKNRVILILIYVILFLIIKYIWNMDMVLIFGLANILINQEKNKL